MNNKIADIANALDIKKLYKLADMVDQQMNEGINAKCQSCEKLIGTPLLCNACGWTDSLLCKDCAMKKYGITNNACPECGAPLSIPIKEAQIISKTLTYQEKQKAHCIFPKNHPKVKDNKDHYPIPDLSHAQNALARSHQDIGSWFDGSAKELQNIVKLAVYKKFPGLKKRKQKRENLK
jgi:hypothetical protein